MIYIAKPSIGQEEIDAVTEVLKSGMLAQGPKVAEFEERFAEYCGTKHAVAYTNGTAAIHGGVYALGISEGDSVITAPFTFVGSANPVLMQNAEIIFADISEDDFCIDPKEVEKKTRKDTKGIIPIDLYGQVYKADEIQKFAEENDIKVLEDACQAIGAEHGGKKAGNFGDAAAFSLYATKNIMTGEGGILVTDNEEYAEKARQFRHHGQSESKRYEYLALGYNYRMTDVLAAIGIEQLKKVDGLNKKRIENAEMLTDMLRDIEDIVLPSPREGNSHVYHQYTIRVHTSKAKNRDGLLDHLKENEIGAGVYYPKPLHLHEHFMKMGYKKGDFPVSEKASEEVLSLPVHPALSTDNLEHIAASIKDYFKS